jgi:hypothetical protein
MNFGIASLGDDGALGWGLDLAVRDLADPWLVRVVWGFARLDVDGHGLALLGRISIIQVVEVPGKTFIEGSCWAECKGRIIANRPALCSECIGLCRTIKLKLVV